MKILAEVVAAGIAGRRVGNTTAAVAGAHASGGTVVSLDDREAERVRREFGCDAVSVHRIGVRSRGDRRPLLFDASTVASLCEQALQRIGEVERARDIEYERSVRLAGDVARLTMERDAFRDRLWALAAETGAERF